MLVSGKSVDTWQILRLGRLVCVFGHIGRHTRHLQLAVVLQGQLPASLQGIHFLCLDAGGDTDQHQYVE